jgi:GTP-binding protein
VVNKVDNVGRRQGLVEFYALGTERLQAISAEHGLGVDDLLEATAAELPGMRPARPAGTGEPEDAAAAPPARADGGLRVAFVGRPNVGKSSLVNLALGRARMIVSEVAGTTREAVETSFHLYGRDYVLVDTAGIRRRARTHEHLEKLGVLHSLGALDWVQVAVLVVDASEELATQDARIASYIVEHRRAVVVALNKWDRVAGNARRAREVEDAVRERLRFLEFAALVRTSAVDGTGIQPLFREIGRAATQFQREIQTADLNRMVQAATLRFPPPAQRGSPTRIYYGAQVGTGPPAFRFFTNHPKQIDDAYTRFFENQLRHHFGLQGTPVRIDWRARRREETRPAGAARQGPRQGARTGARTGARQGARTDGASRRPGRGPGVPPADAPRARAPGKPAAPGGPRKRVPVKHAASGGPRKRAATGGPRGRR